MLGETLAFRLENFSSLRCTHQNVQMLVHLFKVNLSVFLGQIQLLGGRKSAYLDSNRTQSILLGYGNSLVDTVLEDGGQPIFWAQLVQQTLLTSLFRGTGSTIQAAAKVVAGCISSGEVSESVVPVYDFADFLRRHVSMRLRPTTTNRGAVLAKVDVEGAEYEILMKLLEEDAKESTLHSIVDLFMIEWHAERGAYRLGLQKRFWSSAFRSERLDDESYSIDPHPLPQRISHAANAPREEDKWSSMTVSKDGLFWHTPDVIKPGD